MFYLFMFYFAFDLFSINFVLLDQLVLYLPHESVSRISLDKD